MAAGGAVLGLAFAQWAGRLLVAQLTALSRQVSLDLALDWRVLAFTTAVTGATVLLFGSGAGVRHQRHRAAGCAQGAGASEIAGGRRLTLRHALVIHAGRAVAGAGGRRAAVRADVPALIAARPGSIAIPF